MNDYSVSENDDGIDFLYMAEPAPDNHVTYLRFSESISDPDIDTDYFDLDSAGVFSERIKNKLEELGAIKFLQFVPATIKGYKKHIITDFWIGNIYLEIACFDPKSSKYAGITNTGRWEGISNIVIDREKMSNIPLEERLVLVSHEGPQFYLYHKSIVDVIRAASPKGMSFVNIEQWHVQSIYGL